ncbi:NUDIX domain-containing protein [Streptomyces sp. NPDC090108]|uniref:NUDIX domain-containing protein n=1 Tax=Streptomyces sp. NPDC090108 TaxID=3365947 RepID=UPI00380F0A38
MCPTGVRLRRRPEEARRVGRVQAECCIQCNTSHSLQLRSVYGTRPWQFPGGNQDTGEDPVQTARREAVEETGLTHWPSSPALLLVHYLHPEGQWPLPRVGFVFDGGRLSRDQLDRIRLDPDEHSEWAVHSWAEWERRMNRRGFARLKAVEEARRGSGPALLITGPASSSAPT